MNPESQEQRLSRITTLWSLVQQAHAGLADAATTAQRRLMERYCGAVYRYLLGALRDEDAALELFQEFAVRFLRGDFRRADPHRGRFRDYVKTALIHLVTDYHRARRETPQSLPAEVSAPLPTQEEEVEATFLDGWREELLNRTWEALRAGHATYHAVLLAHVDQPDLPSPRRAEELSAKLGKPFSAGQVRVNLHRARARFAELLLNEVAQSLECPNQDAVADELRELRLLKLCEPALVRGRV